jgi:dihydroflavonol-4-reductase
VSHVRVLVTGATGFLGTHVVEQLLSAGHQVRALVRTPLQRTPVEIIRGDVTDPLSLERAAAGCEAVIHCAAVISFRARQAAHTHRVNVEGTRNLLAAARGAGVKRFVFTSSVAALGRPNGEPADETARYDWPVGLAYNESKRDAEELVRAADALETVCLNPALVLGPEEQHRHMLPLFRAVRWGLVPVVPDGGVTLCDVRDVAAAHVAALERGTPGARYVLGGPQLTFVEFISAMAAAVGARAPRLELPAALVRGGVLPLVWAEKLGLPLPYSPRYAPYLTTRGFYRSDRAVAELGYRTRDAAETIGDAVAWYCQQGWLLPLGRSRLL